MKVWPLIGAILLTAWFVACAAVYVFLPTWVGWSDPDVNLGWYMGGLFICGGAFACPMALYGVLSA